MPENVIFNFSLIVFVNVNFLRGLLTPNKIKYEETVCLVSNQIRKAVKEILEIYGVYIIL